MSSYHSNRMGFRDWVLLGPKLAFIVGAILILDTITNDPSVNVRDERLLLLERIVFPDRISATQAEQVPAPGNETDYSWGLLPPLFSPSFWPYAEEKEDIPQNSTDGNKAQPVGRYPGKQTVLTDYRKDVLVPVDDFMVMDTAGVMVPRPGMVSRNGPYATCRFVDYQYSFYFPHVAQQVFRCWSFWLAHPDKTPVFVTSQEYHWKLAMEKEFNRGIMQTIQQYGVQILNSSSIIKAADPAGSISATTNGPILGQSGTHYQVASTEDMKVFRDTALSTLNLSQPIRPSFCGHPSNLPRIGILSRRKSRRIKNVRDVANELKDHFKITNREIPVVYFENAPFWMQVAFMASTDILITAHGAQETGIAFMPKCGAVLELLPNQYFFPRFYGTLAASAGVQHSYLYLAQNTSDETLDVLQRDVGFLAPSMHRIREGVDTLVEQWRKCCELQAADEFEAKKQ